MMSASPIIPATLEWRGNVPVSSEYGDVYFSLEGGLEETEHVFLQGNHLASRFAQANRFVIAELGFGTGLNMLMAWRLWRQCAPAKAQLHLISVEKHPLSRPDLMRAHQAWPMLAEQAATLHVLYPPALPGFHTLKLDDQVTLTLCFGDVLPLLRQMRAGVDAWFLDGFSPARNEAMWQDAVFHEVGRLTKPDGTAATFSVAASVRDGLAKAGFTVEKQSGYGRKRHMLVARFTGNHLSGYPRVPHIQKDAPEHAPEHAIIIGAGIAGASAARALAEQNVAVTLLEAAPMVAHGASGTPAAMLFPRIAKEWTPASRADWSALYALRRRWVSRDHHSGLIQLPKCQRGVRDEIGWMHLPQRLGMPSEVVQALTPDESSEASGVVLSLGGLLLHDSALVDLAAIVRQMADHPLIHHVTHARAVDLTPRDGGWCVTMADQSSLTGSIVVVATGWEASAILGMTESCPLPLTPVRGQLTYLPSNDALRHQRLPIGYGGYLSPPDASGYHWLGATFERTETMPEVSAQGHQENLEKLHEVIPQAALPLASSAALQGWSGIRATSPDRLPVIGQACDHHGVPIHGLYVSLAHGSRGALTGPLGGALIASLACGLPLTLEAEVAALYDPARFIKRSKRSA